MPNNASVFVVADPPNWCFAPDEARAALKAKDAARQARVFEAELRAAFARWPDVHGELLPEDIHVGVTARVLARKHQEGIHCARNANASDVKQSAFSFEVFKNWYRASLHYSAAERLRRRHGPHDVIFRVRSDTLFRAEVRLPPTATARQVFALGYYGAPFTRREADGSLTVRYDEPGRVYCNQSHPPNATLAPDAAPAADCKWLWRDWIYGGAAEAMEGMANMTSNPMLCEPNTRGLGLMPEEQIALQVQSRPSVRLVPAPNSWRLRIQFKAPAEATLTGSLPLLEGQSKPCGRFLQRQIKQRAYNERKAHVRNSSWEAIRRHARSALDPEAEHSPVLHELISKRLRVLAALGMAQDASLREDARRTAREQLRADPVLQKARTQLEAAYEKAELAVGDLAAAVLASAAAVNTSKWKKPNGNASNSTT